MIHYQEYQIPFGTDTLTVYALKTNRDLSDAVITISYQANNKKLVQSHFDDAPTVNGCVKYAAFNGGAFYPFDSSVTESLVRNMVEYGSSSDNTSRDFIIKNRKVRIEKINHANGGDDYYYTKLSLARGSHKLSFRKSNGTWIPEGDDLTYGSASYDKRTLIGANNKYLYFIVIDTPVTQAGITAVLNYFGCSDAVNMDGGGSSGCYLANVNHDSGRLITDAFIIYKKEDYYLNNPGHKLAFRSSPVGSLIYRLPEDSSVRITDFLGIKSDGYQWAKVYDGAQEGYCQIDTHGYTTISGGLDNTVPVYLYATQLQFAIRTAPVNGSVSATVTVGNRAKILEFLPGFESDGYQWVKVQYGSTIGYSQIDTYNCYTVDN